MQTVEPLALIFSLLFPSPLGWLCKLLDLRSENLNAANPTVPQSTPTNNSSEDNELTIHTHHAIDYIELPVRDLAAAKRFYGEAFGWKFNDYGDTYAGIQGEHREVGGLAQLEEGASDEVKTGGPLVILYSSNLEASLDAVVTAGGKIVQPIFSFPGGRRFHFTDPSGNELAVWTQS